MTKEQFIKRVEEITGYSVDFQIREHFSFVNCDRNCLDINAENIRFYELVACSMNGTGLYEEVLNLPHEWLIPLGEAIKEYYREEDERC